MVGVNFVLDIMQVVCQVSMVFFVCVSGEELKMFWQNWVDKFEFEVLCGLEIGLVMMCGCIGGGGVLFNVGEVIVICVIVCLVNGFVGYFYVFGCDQEKVRFVVLFDVFWIDEVICDVIESDVFKILCGCVDVIDVKWCGEVVVIKVDFFIMVWGDN